MPRNSKPINRLASGSWQVRWRDQEGRQRAQTFRRQVDAQRFLDQTMTEVRLGTWVDPELGRELFAGFAERWASSQDWKQTTRDSFGPHLRRLLPHLGEHELARIDKLTLEQTRQALVDAGYARSTVTITTHYASAILRAAYQSGLIARDPTVGVRPPRRRTGDTEGRVSPDDVPTRAEVRAILTAAAPRYRAAVLLGATGLRVSEMLAVSADRYDRTKGELLIDRQLQRLDGVLQFTGPKREKVRSIILPMAVRLELDRHLRDHQGAGLLFRGVRGAEMLRRDQFYESAWRPALVGAGMAPDRFKFHSLRHFAASSMLADGASSTAVAGHLGDTLDTISKVYAHWLRDDRHIPAMILDRLLADESVEEAAR